MMFSVFFSSFTNFPPNRQLRQGQPHEHRQGRESQEDRGREEEFEPDIQRVISLQASARRARHA